MNDKLRKLLEVYSAVRILGGRGSSRKISEVLGVSDRTVQRYLKLLVDKGYIEPVRHGMSLYYRVVKPLTESEAEKLLKGEEKHDAPVYQVASTIETIINEGEFRADLVGAAKIHSMVPTHSRITHDIDVVVAREHASPLVASLRYGIGLLLERRGGVHADYRLRHPMEDIKVDIMVDGFKEEGRMVWNLAPVLRKRKLTLEHALLAKLTRRSFREDNDAYDVAVSLPHVNLKWFTVIYRDLKENSPQLAVRVEPHLDIVERYVLKEYTGADADIILKRIRQVKELIRNTDDVSETLNLSS